MRVGLVLLGWCWLGVLAAQPFHFPTANQALLVKGAEERFLVGTTGKPWTTGGFGCVRSDGWQMHEGLDIRCLNRDAQGEPTDPVLATAAGTVVYFSTRPALSNYGRYVVVRHLVEGLEVYSLYAHLSEVRPGLRLGQAVRAGEPLGTMGRSSNTHERISKARAHVHFELNLLVNDRFADWLRRRFPTERNDHGEWNGRNLLGFDPAQVLLEEQRLGPAFSLVSLMRGQTELCRVLVRQPAFPWVRRYTPLLVRNPRAEKEGVAGYELELNLNGIPFQIIPRAASELPAGPRFQLLSVNAAEARAHPCRRLVVERRGRWELGARGRELLELLTY